MSMDNPRTHAEREATTDDSPDAPCPDCGAHPPHNQPDAEIDCNCGVTGCLCDPQTHAEREAAQRWDEGNGCGTCAACYMLTDDGVWDDGRLLCPPCFDGCTAEPRSTAPGLQPALTNESRVVRAALYRACVQYSTPHTHPCPTCHHDRSCTCTVFVPGEPLECATCSQCRGW